MKQTSKRMTSLLLALLFLVAAFVLFFELIEPSYGNLQTLKGQQLSEAAVLATEQQTVSQAQMLLTEYKNDTTAEASLAQAMPTGPDVAGALAQVYGVAAASGLAVQTIGIQAPSVQITPSAVAEADASGTLTLDQIVKPVGEITFQLSAQGSYEGLQAFLAGIESNLRIFDVTGFSIAPNATAAVATTKAIPVNQDSFTYNFSLVTYYQTP